MAISVKSNLEFIKSGTGTISGTISSAQSNCNSGLETFSSTTMCPSSEPAVVAALLTCYKGMLGTLSGEMEQINVIGEGFASLDNVMAGIATSLPMEIKSINAAPVEALPFDEKASFDSLTSSLDSMIVASGLDKDTFAPKTNTTTSTNSSSQAKTNTGSGSQSSSGGSAGGGGGSGYPGTSYREGYKEKESTKEESEKEETKEKEPEKEKEPARQMSYVETNTPPAEPIKEENTEPEEIEILDVNIETKDEPIENNIINEVVDNTEVVEPEAAENTEENKTKSPMGTIGTIAGIGLAGAAAAAYGYNKYKQNHDSFDDEDEDYEEDGDE